jgi:hypothetical protein
VLESTLIVLLDIDTPVPAEYVGELDEEPSNVVSLVLRLFANYVRECVAALLTLEI